VKRHASPEELASLDADALRPRKAAKIAAHLKICVQCQQVNGELTGVSTLLATASVEFPPMPEQLGVRIETALRAEATQRLSSEPATAESGRRDLPARASRPGSHRRGWRLPGLSVGATRLVAAAGAIVIIGGGGYEVASHVGTQTGTSSSSGNAPNAALPSALPAAPVNGPNVSYHQAGSTRTIRAVRSDTNFVSSKLGLQAAAAVTSARRQGVVPMKVSHSNAAGSPDLTPSSSGPPVAGMDQNGPAGSQLDGCVANVAGDQNVLLVELAKYEGKPATIIVLSATANRSAEVWVVNSACSAADKHVLTSLKISRT
jgi:hypothetical protein